MTTKKNGLGRGLNSLIINTDIPIDSESKVPSIDGLTRLNLNDIKPNDNQPRKVFHSEKIEDLANSIKEHGVIQPIVVRKTDLGYEIVAGERRWRAAREAGLKEVPCIIRELSDEQNMLFAIIENMQREDLNPIEEAEGLEKMIETFGLTQEEVSKSVGKSRPYITNLLRLLKLPKEIQEMISNGDITTGHGRALITVENTKRQIEIAKKIKEEGMSVRKIEALASDKKKIKGKPAKRARKDADILLVERELTSAIGTKVNINKSADKSTVEIECYSGEELERIVDMLKNI